MKNRILFVDDEPRILEGIGRMLHGICREYDMSFASSGRQALEMLAGEPFDMVVSDMRMPEMNGLELLSEVKSRHPNVIRIILSGNADMQLIMRSVGLAHQFLSKPCEAENLRSTIVRSLDLRTLLTNEAIQELIGRLSALPSLPFLYSEIVQHLQSPDPSIHSVGEIIAKDPGMTAKILQLVNSAFFGIRRVVASPQEAAAYLGLDTIQSLVLSLKAFSQFADSPVSGCRVGQIWNHSMSTGLLSKKIAERESPNKGLAAEAFTAGLLHDLGKLVLAANLGHEYTGILDRAVRDGDALQDAELERFGSTHAEIGAYLLGLWGLPNPIVEAVALHHRPGDSSQKSFGSLAAVHAANLLQVEYGARNAGSQLDMPYLEALGKTDRLSEWRQWCREN